jgi:AcrR family transcriptional regulator
MSTTAQAGIERLPRGPHRLSREQVENHQRERIIAAMIATAGMKGYGSTTIGDITHRARVSRDTFYEQFANKEQCLLAAYDSTTRELLDQMVAAGTSQPSYVEGIRDGVRAYLRFWSERADAARVWSLDILAAGEEALVHRERTLESFTRLFQAIAERAAAEQPGLPTVPDLVARAIVVAAVELTNQYIREDRVSSLPELESDVLYLWLMVIAGHEVAAAAVATVRQSLK